MDSSQETSIRKAWALLDDKLFNPQLKALVDMPSFSGDDRPKMVGVRIPFREMRELGVDTDTFKHAGNSLSAYTVLLEEALLNRTLPPSFLDYGRTHRVSLDDEGVTFLMSEHDVIKPIERLSKWKKLGTPTMRAVERIFAADLDYQTADIQRGRGEGWANLR